ncbi:MAG: glucuronate isomerase [Lachnospiraceae bacterium]
MKPFMNEDFLLSTETSKKLYHEFASHMPIIDYHCHISPKEIYENRKFENITQVWLGGDHYKWRQMRSNGVDERFITGDADDREKFQKWAETLDKAIGNPLYHWSNLELKRYFGYEGHLNARTAEEVWNLCNEMLSKEEMTVRNLIKKSNVKFIGTTDDPKDPLTFHKLLKDDPDFETMVCPSFRPDRAMNLEKPDFLEYLNELTDLTGMPITGFSDLMDVIKNRMDYFDEVGCKASDHGLNYVAYEPASVKEVEEIFLKRADEKEITPLEKAKFQTAFMVELGKECAKRNWVMQLHFGCKRDNNTRMHQILGPDTGFDCIADQSPVSQLADFLNALDQTNELPKTVIYSLNPNDDAAIGTIIGCFQGTDVAGKIQHGSAWWFNDTRNGMIAQMTSLANLGLLGNFIGMLTDSRSFLSYTRHEYFRRILCEMVGQWVENGEYPNDEESLKEIIEGISSNNASRYLGI